jgi:glycerophosphoryl diester phosphodiesterase
MLKTLRRSLSLVLITAILMSIGFIPAVPAAASGADELFAGKMYALTDAGGTLHFWDFDLYTNENRSNAAVQADFEDWNMTGRSGTPVVINNNAGTITGITRGVHEVRLAKGNVRLTLYIVAKNAEEAEHVLYETNFAGVANGTLPVGWLQGVGVTGNVNSNLLTVANGAYAIASHRPVLMPAYLHAFPNMRFGASKAQTARLNESRWSSFVWNSQNSATAAGTRIPYYHWIRRGSSQNDSTALTNFHGNWADFALQSLTALPLNQTNRYRIDTLGNSIKTYIDNSLIIDTTTRDNNPNLGGRLGFSGSDMTFRISNIRVVYNNGSLSATETLSNYALPFTYPNPALNVSFSFPFITTVQQPVTSIADAPTIVAGSSLNPLTVSAPANGRPASAVLQLGSGLTVANAGSAPLTTVLTAMQNRVIPVFRIDSATVAAEFIHYFEDNNISDGILMSGDPAVLRQLRTAIGALQGALAVDGSGTIDQDMLNGWVRSTNSNLGRIIYIENADYVSKEDLLYLQNRLMSVWVDSPAETVGAYEQLVNGPNGLVTGNVAQLYTVYQSFTGTTPTMVRTPVNAFHRASPSITPQNTVEGALLAIQNGANAIEYDIMITACGELINFHDEQVGALTGCPRNRNVWDMTLDEIKALTPNIRADYSHSAIWEPDDFADIQIPTIWEFMEAIAPYDDVLFLTEIKDIRVEARTHNIITTLSRQVDEFRDVYGICLRHRFIFISFSHSPALVSLVREHFPDSTFGGLASPNPDTWLTAEALIQNFAPLNMIVNRNTGAINAGGRPLLQALNHRGMPKVPWTYRLLSEVSRDYTSGVAGMTNSHGQLLSNVAVSFTPDKFSYDIEIGQRLDITGTTVNRHKNVVPVHTAAPAVISGGSFITINADGSITGTAAGTAVIIPRGITNAGTSTFLLPGQPVTITVAGNFEGENPAARPALVPNWSAVTVDYDLKPSALTGTTTMITTFDEPVFIDINNQEIYFDITVASGTTGNITLYFGPLPGGNVTAASAPLSLTPPMLRSPAPNPAPSVAPGQHIGNFTLRQAIDANRMGAASIAAPYRNQGTQIQRLANGNMLKIYGIGFTVTGGTFAADALTVNSLFAGHRGIPCDKPRAVTPAIIGTPDLGAVLSAQYEFYDPAGIPEHPQGSLIQWQVLNGNTYADIPDATGFSFTYTEEQAMRRVRYTVTPRNADGDLGEPAPSNLMGLMVMPCPPDCPGGNHGCACGLDMSGVFNMFNLDPDLWTSTHGNWDGGAATSVTVERVGGEYRIRNHGGGWPNARQDFTAIPLSSANNWGGMELHFDFTVTSGASFTLYSGTTSYRLTNALSQRGGGASLAPGGDLTARDFKGSVTLQQLFTTTWGTGAGIPPPASFNTLSGLQIHAVGGDIIVREFRISSPAAAGPTAHIEPTASVNFNNELLRGLDNAGIYSFNGGAPVTLTGSTYPIPASWQGTNVSVVRKGDGVIRTDSLPQTIAVPARPSAPSTPAGIACTVRANNDGRITGVSTAMEYRKSDAAAWIPVTGGTVNHLTPGTYYVRFRATNSGFSSAHTAVTVQGFVQRGYILDRDTVTVADASLAFRGLLGLVALTPEQEAAATLDGDTLTIGHVMRIFRYALGLSDTL